MKRSAFLFFLLIMGLTCTGTWASEDKVIKMSTTTSTQASGLLDILLPAFTEDTGIVVQAIAKGTGAALRDGEDGNVDVVFVHARQREDDFVAQGFGTKRYGVMHNDFIIVGPANDPAAIRGCRSAVEALKKIAATSTAFVSRGDDSGTHTKEQALWKKSGLELKKEERAVSKKGKKRLISFEQPEGPWYLSIGQGMGKTLTLTDEKQAYTLADRGTYIKYKYGRDVPLSLEILCEGDKILENPYGVIPVNPKRHPHVQYEMAERFAHWLVSERGQQLIDSYRLLGKQLFYPDAQ